MQKNSIIPQIFDEFSLDFHLKVLHLINSKKNIKEDKCNNSFKISTNNDYPYSMEALIKYVIDLIESATAGRDDIVINEIDTPLKYAFAAWADEIIIRNFRDEDDFKYLGVVEYELYGTRESGEKLFQHINYILDNEIVSDLAFIYRKMISLGYRGYLYQRGDGDDHVNISYLYSDLCQITEKALATVYQPDYIKERKVPSLMKDRFNYHFLLYLVSIALIVIICIWFSNTHWATSYVRLNRYANELMIQYLDVKEK